MTDLTLTAEQRDDALRYALSTNDPLRWAVVELLIDEHDDDGVQFGHAEVCLPKAALREEFAAVLDDDAYRVTYLCAPTREAFVARTCALGLCTNDCADDDGAFVPDGDRGLCWLCSSCIRLIVERESDTCAACGKGFATYLDGDNWQDYAVTRSGRCWSCDQSHPFDSE